MKHVTFSFPYETVVNLNVDLVLDEVLQHITLEGAVHTFLVEFCKELFVLWVFLWGKQTLWKKLVSFNPLRAKIL